MSIGINSSFDEPGWDVSAELAACRKNNYQFQLDNSKMAAALRLVLDSMGRGEDIMQHHQVVYRALNGEPRKGKKS